MKAKQSLTPRHFSPSTPFSGHIRTSISYLFLAGNCSRTGGGGRTGRSRFLRRKSKVSNSSWSSSLAAGINRAQTGRFPCSGIDVSEMTTGECSVCPHVSSHVPSEGAPPLSRFVRQGGGVDLPILGIERQKLSGLVSIAPPTKLPCHYALGLKAIPGSALRPFRYIQLLCSRAPTGLPARSRPV